MENCLVTRYKFAVSGQLPFLSVIIIGVEELTATNSKLKIGQQIAGSVKVIIPKEKTLTINNDSYVLEEDDDYKYYTLNQQYSNEIVFDKTSKYDIYVLGANLLSSIQISDGNTALRYKDITPLNGNDGLSIFGNDNSTNYANIVGTILDFASPALTNTSLGNNQLSGNIEDFLESMWEKGRRSGTCNMPNFGGANIKLHNVATENLQSFSASFSSGSITLTSGGSTVATYNGTTWIYA